MIFATNEDLESKIAKKEFRLDLFYRISVLKIRIPPLRERKADIIPLARHMIQKENSDKILSPGAVERLEAHSWPGNARELKNVLLRGMVMSKHRTISHRDIMF
jgi:transcriptional regulator of aroF, aroG, tyrA and aromatic amino acid transport